LWEALRGLSETLILQGRYGEVGALASEFVGHPQLVVRSMAEFMWGTSLSLEGLDLDAAVRHLLAAAALADQDTGLDRAVMGCQIQFELGHIDARQNRLEDAIRRYRECLQLADTLPDDSALRWHIMAHNNLAYHLHLLDDPTAWDHVQTGLALAREKGMVTMLPYLLSTLGELALAQGDLAAAEGAFQRGLAYAQRFAHPERIAGLTANLGLVALRRGETELAAQRLRAALEQAEVISSRFMAAQIRLWLAPLLPPEEARPLIAVARGFIATGRYDLLAPLLAEAEAALPV
jgi:tetratricopeptide (TPR) repeat protein